MLGFLRKAIRKTTGIVFEADVDEMIAKARKIHNMDSMGGGGWGNSIKYADTPKTITAGTIIHIVGWKPHRPKVKDLLRMRLASGKVAIGIFINVELCNRVWDMFFGDVRLIAYDLNYDAKSK